MIQRDRVCHGWATGALLGAHPCGQRTDEKLHASEKAVNSDCFEVWCVDKSSFGLRYLKKDAAGAIVDERWVGLCGNGGGPAGVDGDGVVGPPSDTASTSSTAITMRYIQFPAGRRSPRVERQAAQPRDAEPVDSFT